MKRSKNIFMAIVSTILIFALSIPAFAKVKTITIRNPVFYRTKVYMSYSGVCLGDKIIFELSTSPKFTAKETMVLEAKGKRKRIDARKSAGVYEDTGEKVTTVNKTYQTNAKNNKHMFAETKMTNGNKSYIQYLYWPKNKKHSACTISFTSENYVPMNPTVTHKHPRTRGFIGVQMKTPYKDSQDLYCRIKLYMGSKLVARSPKTKVTFSDDAIYNDWEEVAPATFSDGEIYYSWHK